MCSFSIDKHCFFCELLHLHHRGQSVGSKSDTIPSCVSTASRQAGMRRMSPAGRPRDQEQKIRFWGPLWSVDGNLSQTMGADLFPSRDNWMYCTCGIWDCMWHVQPGREPVMRPNWSVCLHDIYFTLRGKQKTWDHHEATLAPSIYNHTAYIQWPFMTMAPRLAGMQTCGRTGG